MSDLLTPAFDAARHGRTSIPVVAYVLYTNIASHVWAQGQFSAELGGAPSEPFDGDVAYDADILFDSGWSSAESAARVLSFGAWTIRTAPVVSDVLVSMTRSERANWSVELSNADGVMSELLAVEYVLGRTARLLIGWQGLGVDDYLEKGRATVSRWILRGRRSLTLEHVEP